MLHGSRKDRGDLLPGEQGQTAAEFAETDGAENLEPVLNEVRAAGVAEDYEAARFVMGGEDAADQLVGIDAAKPFDVCRDGQGFGVEDVFEGRVALNAGDGGALEAGFGELGFYEERAEEHVDFCSI